MRFTKFVIDNFKGIKHAELNLDQFGQGKVFTLVGLNECGKTTILEAINSFSPENDAEKLFTNDVFKTVKHRDLVPKHNKANFSGVVSVEAHLEMSDRDIIRIEKYFEETHGLVINKEALGNTFSIRKIFKFENSDFKKQSNTWSINLCAKTKRSKNYRDVEPPNPVWRGAVVFIRGLIPAISYFPTFLFEFPARVYLSNTPENLEPQNKYYKQIIQDVLDSLGTNLTIDEHIVDRVEKIDEGTVWDFFNFWSSDRREQVDAVMNHLASKITKSVFMRWNEIFKSKFRKHIKIDWSVDKATENPPIYLSFNVQDGTSSYSISERSLGFRWFFCFLLFTQFRKSRGGSSTLFLFDEPASNLHATAQQQLLDSFGAITDGGNSLIYSTHSHYMINPKWLEGAFIVQNGAIDYDEELSEMHEYQQQVTDIIVTPYRRFVGENPDKSTYYQPILDSLDYSPSILEHQSSTVMVEGKGDYYVLTYFKDVVLGLKDSVKFLPSSGAGELGPLISLYLGWGYTFAIMLDDDSAGKKAKSNYIGEWFLDDKTVTTIGTFGKSFSGKKLEGLITKDGKDIIKEQMGVKRLTKKQITRFFQGALATNKKIDFDKVTVENFKQVIDGTVGRCNA